MIRAVRALCLLAQFAFAQAALAQGAFAQDWATPASCALPDVPQVDPAVLPPGFAAAEAAIVNGTGRLWRVETGEGRISHLWGTIHSSARPVLDLPDTVVALIEGASVIATETDVQTDSRAEVERLRRFDGFWTTGEYNARDDLPPQVMAWIIDRAEALGYAAADVGQMTDAGLVSLLLSDPCEDFFSWAVPVQDNWIATLGHMNRVPLAGLEPADRILQDLSSPWMQPAARAMLVLYGSALAPPEAAAGAGNAGETYAALYLAGRIGAMMALEPDRLAEVVGAAEAARTVGLADAYLLTARNRRFVDNAMPLIRDGGAFLAVGAFHLPRDDGMVALLRARGLTVSRVPLPGEAP